MTFETEMAIRRDDLSDGHIVQLLEAHRQEMLKHSPPESVHALDTHQLNSSNIRFWSAWIDNQHFAGCGALMDLGAAHGELKSMKTDPNHLRKGVAQAILNRIIDTAYFDGFKHLSLETGTQEVFQPARSLYLKYGFHECAPFGSYRPDPLSVCMTLAL